MTISLRRAVMVAMVAAAAILGCSGVASAETPLRAPTTGAPAKPSQAPATEAPAERSGKVTIHLPDSTVQTFPSATQANIDCKTNVQNPHNSGHVNGTVNVVVTITCTPAYPGKVQLSAVLYFNNRLVKDSGSKTFLPPKTAKMQNNAAVPCKNGSYQGYLGYGFFSPNAVPPAVYGSKFGSVLPILC